MALAQQCHTGAKILKAPVRNISGNRGLLPGAPPSLCTELTSSQMRSAGAGHMASCGFSGKLG